MPSAQVAQVVYGELGGKKAHGEDIYCDLLDLKWITDKQHLLA